jgi:NADH dehydrogenase FAD-containing subunit
MATQRDGKKLVFVGGGHVHLLCLKNTDRFVREGAEVTLIGPDRFHYYSGMGPGMVSGFYKPEQVRFDIQTMVTSRGGVFVQGKVTSIDGPNKTLTLESGQKIPYDVVSFNVGSYVPMDRIRGAQESAIPVKPIEKLQSVQETILKRVQNGEPKTRVLVIGAGPAGVELAGNIWRLARDQRGRVEITVANSRDRLLPNLTEKVGILTQASLTRRGIRILPDFRVAHMEHGVARSRSGDEVSFDLAILTIGIMPQRIFADSGLATSNDGALLVSDRLESTNSTGVFGGGDCIAIKGHPVDRVGVYAVREAPILFENLLARLTGKPLRPFRPQRRYLLIFNLGDGSGIFVRGSWVWQGRLAFTLKNYLDTRFMARFQVSGERG